MLWSDIQSVKPRFYPIKASTHKIRESSMEHSEPQNAGEVAC